MANIFVFGNYAVVAANMPNREFRALNVISKRSKTLVLAKMSKTFRSAKSFRLKSKTFC